MKHPGHAYGGFVPAISEWGMTHFLAATLGRAKLGSLVVDGVLGGDAAPHLSGAPTDVG
jgi:hypothetical protein